MPTEAQWDNLKPGYRQRLIRKGYTKEDYLANRSRQAFRGHGKTPEHPRDAARHPERYAEYRAKRPEMFPDNTPLPTQYVGDTPGRRQELIDRLTGELSALLRIPRTRGGIEHFDVSTLEFGIMNMPTETFLHAVDLNVQQWRDLGRYPFTGPGADAWYDHIEEIGETQRRNPFFYH